MGILKLFSAPKAPAAPPPVEVEPVEAPELEPVPVIPNADDTQLKTQARKRVAARSQRSGRLSTFLSSQNEKLG